MKAISKRIGTFASALSLALSWASVLPVSAAEMPADAAPSQTSPIIINEVCTGNNGENGNITTAVDKKGEYCDWVELYNSTGSAIDLKGYTLVKDDSDVYTFDSVSVPGYGHLLVFCCKTYKGDESIPHAAFNLPSSSVKLSLTNGDTVINSVSVPALDKDITWGRKPDGTDALMQLAPTPGTSNNEAQAYVPCNAPIFSADSGMYSKNFDLAISTDSGNTVYYTTDGTDPTTSSTRIKVTQPINIYNRSGDKSTVARAVPVSKLTPWSNGASLPKESAVDKGTVIRAVTYSKAGEYSEVVTKTYFVGVNNASHNGLPILSVTTDPENLFNYDYGIFVKGRVYDQNVNPFDDNPPANYNQRGKEWERAAHIDFFESDGSLVLSQDCGIRTQGAYSRADYQKSLRFYARAEYGPKNFKAALIPNAYSESDGTTQITKYKKFVMRGGGNDNFYTKFKDQYTQRLVNDRSIDTQEGRPCVMFIDGEYWGLYTLQEDFDDHYYEENYGVNADDVVVYKKGEIDEGVEEDIELFNSLRRYCEKNDLSNADNYRVVCDMLDVKSFADYMAAEIFIINEDWPGNNYSMWRTRVVDESNPYADGRWRMNLYDTEMGTNHYGNNGTFYNSDNLKKILSNKNDDMPVIFNALMKNDEFRELFVTCFMDQANVNFAPDRCASLEKYYMETYYPELDRFFARFPTWANRGSATDPCLKRMENFLRKRSGYVPGMLTSDLGLKKAVPVSVSTINPEGGSVYINTSTLDISEGMSGYYHPDYNITLTAQPDEGWVFAGWQGTFSSTDSTVTLSPADAATIQAVFVPENGTSNLHTVTFKGDGVDLSLYVADGNSVTIPDSALAREGYTYTLEGLPDKVTKDVTVTVKYTGISYTVKFMGGGAPGTSYTQSMTYGKSAALLANKYSRTGYVFKGWSRTLGAASPEFTNKQTVSNLTTVADSTVNLYAVWGKNIAKCTVTLASTSYPFSGKQIKPGITVTDGSTTLKKDTDYTLSFSNNVNVGTGYVTVTGIGKYAGSVRKSFKITESDVKIGIASAEVTIPTQYYTGSAVTPDPKVVVSGAVLKNGTDYTVTYKNNIETGKAVAVIVGKGQYNGSRSVSFVIAPKVPEVSDLRSIAKGKIVLTWKKDKRADGYQFIIAEDAEFKTGARTHVMLKNDSISRQCVNLKSGKTYYFKLRSFKTIGGKRYYGQYTEVFTCDAK